jgi:hypothetical protein
MNPDERDRDRCSRRAPTLKEQREAQAKQRAQWLASLRKSADKRR